MSHDECIKLTNCEGIFEDDSGAEDVDMEAGGDSDDEGEGDAAMDEDEEDSDDEEAPAPTGGDKVDWGSDSDDEPAPQPSKKKTRKNQHKVGKERVNDTEEGFFDGL